MSAAEMDAFKEMLGYDATGATKFILGSVNYSQLYYEIGSPQVRTP